MSDVATYESVLSLSRKKGTSCGVSSSPLSRRSHRPPATELVERIIINGKYVTDKRPLTKMKNNAPNLTFPRSSPDTSRLQREDRPGETPQRDSARRLAGRPRKARGVWTADLQE